MSIGGGRWLYSYGGGGGCGQYKGRRLPLHRRRVTVPVNYGGNKRE